MGLTFSQGFEDAIRLFKLWGFRVEPGSRPEEVTLILKGPGYRTYTVYDAHLLPTIAAEGLRARWQNGNLAFRPGSWAGDSCLTSDQSIGPALVFQPIQV